MVRGITVRSEQAYAVNLEVFCTLHKYELCRTLSKILVYHTLITKQFVSHKSQIMRYKMNPPEFPEGSKLVPPQTVRHDAGGLGEI